jgi:hypothetical protein
MLAHAFSIWNSSFVYGIMAVLCDARLNAADGRDPPSCAEISKPGRTSNITRTTTVRHVS